MSISIVITTYGADEWPELASKRAIPSAQKQSADEIIVHHEPDLSIGPARNAAAARATSDWLVFLDADDELDAGYVDRMREAAADGEIKRLYQPAVRYIRKGGQSRPTILPKRDLRRDNYLVIGTMVNSKLFHKVGGFEDFPHGFEDWSCWAKCWKAGAEIVQVPKAVYAAYINPQSQHRRMWRNRVEQHRIHTEVQAKLFPETPRRHPQLRRRG